eukprot:97941_1
MAKLLKKLDNAIDQIDEALEDGKQIESHNCSLIKREIELICGLMNKRKEYRCPKINAEFFAWTQKDKDKCYERLKKELPLIPLRIETHFVSLMAISYKANYPYLPYLCDVFFRQHHDYRESDYTSPENWTSHYIDEHLTFKWRNDQERLEKTYTIKRAVDDYLKRVLPRMNTPQPTKIIDSLAAVSAHVLMFCNIVKELSIELHTAPYQLELCFIFKSVESSRSYGYDDDDIQNDDDVFGDIDSRLKNAKLQYHVLSVNETYNLRKSLMDALNVLVKGNYQQKRLVALIDKRCDLNNVYLYESPCGYVPVTSDSTTQAYMNNSRHTLIPPDISCVSPYDGKLLTFSFHVRQQDDVRCYMYRHGGMMRFMSADVIGKVMTRLFVESKRNTDFAQSEEIASLIKETKYSLVNVAFERFRQSINIFEFHHNELYMSPRAPMEGATDEKVQGDGTAPTVDDDLQNILRPQVDSNLNLMQYFFTLFHANFRDNASLRKLTKHKLDELKVKAFHQLELIRRIEKLKKKQ